MIVLMGHLLSAAVLHLFAHTDSLPGTAGRTGLAKVQLMVSGVGLAATHQGSLD